MDTEAFSWLNINFNENDKKQLELYFRLADTLVDFIGSHSEIAIHSFEDFNHSVVKIINGHHTARTTGSPITDLGLKMLQEFAKTGNLTPKSYFTYNKKGELLKSATSFITNTEGKPIGMFCINMNLSYPFPEIIKTLLPNFNENQLMLTENFGQNPTDVIIKAINNATKEVDANLKITPKGRNKAISKILFDGGIFELKEAIVLVAHELGITRHAIYKFLRQFKSE